MHILLTLSHPNLIQIREVVCNEELDTWCAPHRTAPHHTADSRLAAQPARARMTECGMRPAGPSCERANGALSSIHVGNRSTHGSTRGTPRRGARSNRFGLARCNMSTRAALQQGCAAPRRAVGTL